MSVIISYTTWAGYVTDGVDRIPWSGGELAAKLIKCQPVGYKVEGNSASNSSYCQHVSLLPRLTAAVAPVGRRPCVSNYLPCRSWALNHPKDE